jgi:hypothetical protein
MVAESLSAPVSVANGRVALIERLAGTGGLVFAATVLLQNVIRASGPSFTASPAAVTAYFVDHRAAGLIPLGLFPIEMIALFCFTAGIWVHARHLRDRWCASVGILGVVTIAGLFAMVNIIEIVIAAQGRELLSSPETVRALWAIHAGAFGLDLTAIAVALVGLSRAARTAGLIPRWLAVLALPAAACLVVSSIFTVAIVNGGSWLYLGLVGFAVWGVFLVVAGSSLLRGTSFRLDGAG